MLVHLAMSSRYGFNALALLFRNGPLICTLRTPSYISIDLFFVVPPIFQFQISCLSNNPSFSNLPIPKHPFFSPPLLHQLLTRSRALFSLPQEKSFYRSKLKRKKKLTNLLYIQSSSLKDTTPSLRPPPQQIPPPLPLPPPLLLNPHSTHLQPLPP